MRIALFQLVDGLLVPNHAAHQGDQEVVALFFGAAQVGQLVMCFFFRGLADATGIQHYQVRLIHRGLFPPQFIQHRLNALRVSLIHLTANGPDMIFSTWNRGYRHFSASPQASVACPPTREPVCSCLSSLWSVLYTNRRSLSPPVAHGSGYLAPFKISQRNSSASFFPLFPPAAGEAKRGGAGGRSPMAGGSGVSPTLSPLFAARRRRSEERGCRGTQSHGQGFGGVPRLFLPSSRPAAGEAKRGGAGGRSPMARGSGVSPDSFSPLRGPPQAGREYQMKKAKTMRRAAKSSRKVPKKKKIRHVYSSMILCRPRRRASRQQSNTF